jgi:hypothetical protein
MYSTFQSFNINERTDRGMVFSMDNNNSAAKTQSGLGNFFDIDNLHNEKCLFNTREASIPRGCEPSDIAEKLLHTINYSKWEVTVSDKASTDEEGQLEEKRFKACLLLPKATVEVALHKEKTVIEGTEQPSYVAEIHLYSHTGDRFSSYNHRYAFSSDSSNVTFMLARTVAEKYNCKWIKDIPDYYLH